MGMLSTSLSGLMAFQRSLDVTSHNISNANTEGYSRQVTTLGARAGVGSGNIVVGAGTTLQSVSRSYDGLLVQQLQTSTTGVGRLEALNALTGRVNSLLADPDTGLNSALQNFFGAVQDLSNDPASIPTRQALIGQADGLSTRFNVADQQLSSLGSEVNERLRQAVSDINNIAVSIAEVNNKIASAGPNGRPNDLLDQRDKLVLNLSELVAVQTIKQDDGSLNIFIGSGQGLVVGSTAQELATIASQFDPTQLRIAYASAGSRTPLDNSLNGGTLGGLLEFRNSILNPAREALGQTAVAFAGAFNEQHQNGMDLRGSLGVEFFSIDPPGVLYASGNSGASTMTANVSDLTALTGEDYALSFDGTNYSVVRPGTNSAVAFTGTGTSADPISFDGIQVVVTGVPASGDQFMVRTGLGAASTLSAALRDPLSVAMASATRSSAALTNLGNASMTPAVTTDSSDAGFLSTTSIEFLDPNNYSINGAGSFAYTDGSPILVNGSEVIITGVPNAGDRFLIEPNFGSTGDNANGLRLSDIQSVDILGGGAVSINENYGRLVSDIGSTSNQVIAGLESTLALQRNARSDVLSLSGVNLDEEAARLLQYQQSYQAAAQVITVAATLFDTVLATVRR